MNRSLFFSAVLTALVAFLSACNREDVGPLQEGEKTFSASGFDRLELGSGFDITVRQGTAFSIEAKGDQRNLDDLEVETRNATLTVKYRTHKNRKHTTSFTITRPGLRGVNFSGGSHSTVTGFTNLTDFDAELSGGSQGKWSLKATRTTIDLSGGSHLQLDGLATTLTASTSGASKFEGFNYVVDEASVVASGASKAQVTVNKSLTAEASGASNISYKGNPANLNQNSSGGSTVERN